MSKINLPPFYIGQKIVYIGKKYFPKYSIHKVTNIIMDNCGCWTININNEVPIYTTYKKEDCDMIICCECNKLLPNEPFISNGYSVKIFRPAQEKPLPLLTFEKIKETEKEEILILN